MHLFTVSPGPKRTLSTTCLKSYVGRLEPQSVINITLVLYLLSFKTKIGEAGVLWDKYKRIANPYEYIHTIHPVIRSSVCAYAPLSRAFFKMMEIAQNFKLADDLNSGPVKTFSFAEGPGGFVEAIAHIRRNRLDSYWGMTLTRNDGNAVPGWRKANGFKQRTPNFTTYAGITGDGDMLEPANLLHCYDKHAASCSLVTADGGFDFTSSFSTQEAASLPLVYAQIAYTLVVQEKGGNCVLKFFDTTTAPSLDLLYILWCSYRRVHIYKPDTSRPANSERYIICKDLISPYNYQIIQCFARTLSKLRQGWKPQRFLTVPVPLVFSTSIQEANAIFGQMQLEAISSTLSIIRDADRSEAMIKHNMKKCIRWCEHHNMPINASAAKKCHIVKSVVGKHLNAS